MSYFHAALDGFYQLGETIGSGGFAKVKAAYHILTGEKVAIKIMNKAELGEDLPRVKNEIEALKAIEHEHICQLYQVIDTTERYYIVMEYCPGGELFDYIVEKDRLDEREARDLFRQILSAVGHLHSRGFAHRDLKPENILIDEDQAMKLIDFGLSARPTGGAAGLLTTCCGSPAYAAPELIGQQEYQGSAADVWSLGVLLYALLCGYLPFEDQNLANLYRKIQRGQFELPSWLSAKAAELLTRMMDTDPARRVTVDQLARDRWVTDSGRLAAIEFDGRAAGRMPLLAEATMDDGVEFSPVSDRCLTELAWHCKRPKREVSAALHQRRFDYLTATHLIMCRRVRRGAPIQLMSDHWLAQLQLHHQQQQQCQHQQLQLQQRQQQQSAAIGWGRLLQLLPAPAQFSADCAWLEEKPIPRLLRQQAGVGGAAEYYGGASQTPPPSSRHPTAKDTPICGVAMLTAAAAAAAAASAASNNKENQHQYQHPQELHHQPAAAPTFAVPLTPVRVSRPRHKHQHQQQQPPPVFEPPLATLTNPLSPSRSIDSALHQQPTLPAVPQSPMLQLPQLQLPQSPTGRTPRSVFGSLERLGGRFRQAFTPRKRPGPGGSCESGPRKLSAFHNVTTTDECHPQAVLNKLVRALSDRRIRFKQTGYLLRCQVCDDWGKIHLAFDLEVCGLSKQDGVGVRRKRVKGDSWHYKRLCEDILHTAQLQ